MGMGVPGAYLLKVVGQDLFGHLRQRLMGGVVACGAATAAATDERRQQVEAREAVAGTVAAALGLQDGPRSLHLVQHVRGCGRSTSEPGACTPWRRGGWAVASVVVSCSHTRGRPTWDQEGQLKTRGATRSSATNASAPDPGPPLSRAGPPLTSHPDPGPPLSCAGSLFASHPSRRPLGRAIQEAMEDARDEGDVALGRPRVVVAEDGSGSCSRHLLQVLEQGIGFLMVLTPGSPCAGLVVCFGDGLLL